MGGNFAACKSLSTARQAQRVVTCRIAVAEEYALADKDVAARELKTAGAICDESRNQRAACLSACCKVTIASD